MAFGLLQRSLLANKCHHQSLPLTSLRWQQRRRIGVAVSHRNISFIRIVSAAIATGDASAYDKELHIVEQWRQELGYLLDNCTKESSYSKRDINYELKWLDRLEEVIEFYYKEGRLPKRRNNRDENSLFRWIDTQRTAKQCLDEGKPCKTKMTAERIKILESMSWWVWDALEAASEAKFEELKEYVSKYGEIPPRSHPSLGTWVHTQRMAYKAWEAPLRGEVDKYNNINSNMDAERANKLESLPHWSWEPYEDNWEANYQALVEYVAEHNKIPPRSHPTLGRWINTQRMAYKAWQARLKGEADKYPNETHTMTEERARKLESVPHWKWVVRG